MQEEQTEQQEERAETRWWRRPMTPELKDWMRRRRTHIVVVGAGGLLGFLVFLFMDGASNSDASNAVIASAAFAALRLHVAVGKDGLGIGGPVRRAPGVRAAGGHGGRLGEHGAVGLRDALHEPVGRMDWLGAP